METKLTAYFDDPFRVGVFVRMDDGKLSVCKVTFGAETKDDEVWEFVLEHYDHVNNFQKMMNKVILRRKWIVIDESKKPSGLNAA